MLISYFALLAVLATGCLAVFDGKPAAPHQFPYHVGIYTKPKTTPISELQYWCGGAVISDKWVLTTGDIEYITHSDFKIIVRAGKHIVNQEEPNEQLRFVVRYIIHPEWKGFSRELISRNDLAMLQVDSPFVFNEYVSAARLPSVSAYFEVGSLAGWGLTSMEPHVPNFPEELHYDGYLPVIGPKECSEAINKVISPSSPPVEINSNQTCTFKRNSGASFYDDGSAFVSQEDDKYVVIGIVASTSSLSGVVELPTVYTRVGAYTEWINEVMKSS